MSCRRFREIGLVVGTWSLQFIISVCGAVAWAQVKFDLPRDQLGHWQLDIDETRAFHSRINSQIAADWFEGLGRLTLELRQDQTLIATVDSFAVDPPFPSLRGSWRLADFASNWSHFELEVVQDNPSPTGGPTVFHIGLRARDRLVLRAPQGHWLALQRQHGNDLVVDRNADEVASELSSRLVGNWIGDSAASREWWSDTELSDEQLRQLDVQTRSQIAFFENRFELVPPDEPPERAVVGRWKVNHVDVEQKALNLFGSPVNTGRFGYHFTVQFAGADQMILRIDNDLQVLFRRVTE